MKKCIKCGGPAETGKTMTYTFIHPVDPMTMCHMSVDTSGFLPPVDACKSCFLHIMGSGFPDWVTGKQPSITWGVS